MRVRKPDKGRTGEENSAVAGNKSQPLRIKLSLAPRDQEAVEGLFEQIRGGKWDAALQLIRDGGVDVNTCYPVELEDGTRVKQSVVHAACYFGLCELVDRLVQEYGGDVEVVDQTFRSTALGWAAFGNRFEMCERLAFVYGSRMDVENVYSNRCLELVPESNESWTRLLRVDGDETVHRMNYIVEQIGAIPGMKRHVQTIGGRISRGEYADNYRDGFLGDLYRLGVGEIEKCVRRYSPFDYEAPEAEGQVVKRVRVECREELVPVDPRAISSIRVCSYLSDEQFRGQQIPVDLTVVPETECARSLCIPPGVETVYVVTRLLRVDGKDGRFPVLFSNTNRVPLIEKTMDAETRTLSYRFNVRLASGLNRVEVFSVNVAGDPALKLAHVLVIVRLRE